MKQNSDFARRAMRFGHILTCKNSASDQEGLIDLLADAIHWCDANGEDFHIAFAQACRHYTHELNDQQPDEIGKDSAHENTHRPLHARHQRHHRRP